MLTSTPIRLLGLLGLGAAGMLAALRGGDGFGPLVAATAAVAVIAGLVEAAATRRTGRRRPVTGWLPAAIGMATITALEVTTGPRGPDSGVADGIVVVAMLAAAAALALGVNAVAMLALVASTRRGSTRG